MLGFWVGRAHVGVTTYLSLQISKTRNMDTLINSMENASFRIDAVTDDSTEDTMSVDTSSLNMEHISASLEPAVG